MPVSKRVVFISSRPSGKQYVRAPLYDQPSSAAPPPFKSPSFVQVESPSVERNISIFASEAVKWDAVNWQAMNDPSRQRLYSRHVCVAPGAQRNYPFVDYSQWVTSSRIKDSAVYCVPGGPTRTVMMSASWYCWCFTDEA